MNFESIKNNNANADVPYFELEKGNDILRDSYSRSKYEAYQIQYKKICGVMPELDKIQNPVCAVISDNVFIAEEIQKNKVKKMGSAFWNVTKSAAGSGVALMSGDIGGLFSNVADTLTASASGPHGTEYYPEFKQAFNEGIEKYKYAYSLMCSYDLSFIEQLPVGAYFPMDNLGYRKTEDGTYYEGTWQDDELLYGLMYPSDGSFVFIGTFDESCNPDEGIMFDGAYKMGLFKNYELDCLHGVAINTDISTEDMFIAYLVDVGEFKDGLGNGQVIRYLEDGEGNVWIFKNKYENGNIVKPKLTETIKGKSALGTKRFLKWVEVICYINGGLGLAMGAMGPSILNFAIAGLCTFIRKKKS